MKNSIYRALSIFVITTLMTACASNHSRTTYTVVEDWKPRGDIIGEVVEVVQAPKKCKNAVSSEGANTLLGVLVGGALGNQVGKGNGRKANTVVVALLGGAVANSHNRDNRGKVECEKRGYFMTVGYLDNYGQVRYHTIRSDRKERIGTQLYFKL